LDGAQAVYDEAIKVIKIWKDNPPELEVQHRVLRTAITTLEECVEILELRKWREISDSLAKMLHSDTSEHRDIAKKFLDHFTVGK
jgi:hypothetical protein